jgi:hypothetical protein
MFMQVVRAETPFSACPQTNTCQAESPSVLCQAILQLGEIPFGRPHNLPQLSVSRFGHARSGVLLALPRVPATVMRFCDEVLTAASPSIQPGSVPVSGGAALAALGSTPGYFGAPRRRTPPLQPPAAGAHLCHYPASVLGHGVGPRGLGPERAGAVQAGRRRSRRAASVRALPAAAAGPNPSAVPIGNRCCTCACFRHGAGLTRGGCARGAGASGIGNNPALTGNPMILAQVPTTPPPTPTLSQHSWGFLGLRVR